MIDSLLFLPDVDDAQADARRDLAPEVPAATEPDDAVDAVDAQVAAALAATRDGHAHAAAGAWVAASAAFERSTAIRDALVAAGVAGPIVALRAWADLAAVRAVAGDVDGARAALARVRAGTRDLGEVPADVAAAVAELEAEVEPARSPVTVADSPAVVPPTPATEPDVTPIAGGLLWLDTTDDAVEVIAASAADDARAPSAPGSPPPGSPGSPPARIAAVDDAVALAQGGGTDRVPGGIAARLRRLLKR